MEKNVQIFVLLNFLVIGASHFFQPYVWVDFIKWVRNNGKVGIFAYSFLSLSFGSIIVALHWEWEGIVPIAITCIGIAQIIKSIIGFVLPHYALKNMQKPMAENPNSYKWVGAVFFVLATIAAFSLYA